LKFSLTLNCVTGCQVVGVIMTLHVEQTTVQYYYLWWAAKANSEIKSSCYSAVVGYGMFQAFSLGMEGNKKKQI